MQMPVVEALKPCRTRSKPRRRDSVAGWMKWPKCRCAVPLYGTANLPGASPAHLCVVVGVEPDEYSTRTLVSNAERPTAILWVPFGIANVQHLLDLDWSLVRRFQLLNLAKYGIDVVEPTACLGRVVGG